MKCSRIVIGIFAVYFMAASAYAFFPFTYQGRLYEDGSPADGEYDIGFGLFSLSDPNDPDGIVSRPLILHSVPVSNGCFTVLLDFVPEPPITEGQMFDGSDRWLDIYIRPGELEDPNYYTRLLPMTKISATPYAHTAHRLETPVTLLDDTPQPVLTIENAGEGAELRFENDSIIQYGDDALVDVFSDYQMNIGNSEERFVGLDSTVDIARDRTVTIGQSESKNVSINSDMGIGMNRTTTIGGMDETTTGAHHLNVSSTSVTEAGGNITMQSIAGIVAVNSPDWVQLQNKVRVFNDPNDVLKVDGAITMKPMSPGTPETTNYGKLFVNGANGRIYYLTSEGTAYDLTAITAGRVSFSVKRDASYTWPGSSSFETVDFIRNTAIWDNTGGGFSTKNGEFVAPADGMYSFHGSIFFTGLSKGDLIAAAIIAGGKNYRGDAKTATGTDESVRANVTVYLQADDVVTFEGYVHSASSVTVHGVSSSSEAFTYFNGARVD